MMSKTSTQEKTQQDLHKYWNSTTTSEHPEKKTARSVVTMNTT